MYASIVYISMYISWFCFCVCIVCTCVSVYIRSLYLYMCTSYECFCGVTDYICVCTMSFCVFMCLFYVSYIYESEWCIFIIVCAWCVCECTWSMVLLVIMSSFHLPSSLSDVHFLTDQLKLFLTNWQIIISHLDRLTLWPSETDMIS